MEMWDGMHWQGEPGVEQGYIKSREWGVVRCGCLKDCFLIVMTAMILYQLLSCICIAVAPRESSQDWGSVIVGTV